MNRIYVVTGLPGTGKTEVSQILNELLGGSYINTDDIRNDIFLKKPSINSIKIGQQFEVVYKVLPIIVNSILLQNLGSNIILDGTFRFRWQRDSIIEIGEEKNIPVAIIKVVYSKDEVIKKRMELRKAHGHHADFQTYLSAIKEYEDPDLFYPITNKGSIADLKIEVKSFLSKL